MATIDDLPGSVYAEYAKRKQSIENLPSQSDETVVSRSIRSTSTKAQIPINPLGGEFSPFTVGIGAPSHAQFPKNPPETAECSEYCYSQGSAIPGINSNDIRRIKTEYDNDPNISASVCAMCDELEETTDMSHEAYYKSLPN